MGIRQGAGHAAGDYRSAASGFTLALAHAWPTVSPAASGIQPDTAALARPTRALGFCEDAAAYRDVLAQSHLVLSTAWHDFQGLAVLEAASLGAVPLVPNALAYPEWFGTEYTFGTAEDFGCKDVRALAQSAAENITAYVTGARPLFPVATDQLHWAHLHADYRALFTRVIGEFTGHKRQ